MSITKKFFGKTDNGEEVNIFALTNNNGFSARIIDYGATIVSIFAPDKNGRVDDVVLGYDDLESYAKGPGYIGALIGRYGNRIKAGRFTLNGKEYILAKNDGNNHLHGGIVGFDKAVWKAETITKDGKEALQMSYTSKDGEEGYPGNLDVKVIYTVTDDNALSIEYIAFSDKDTIINLTNHSYFNLGGHKSGSILNNTLKLEADKFTVVDNEAIPTGELRNVEGTPLDFRKPTAIGDRIDQKDEQLLNVGGYDHNFVLNRTGKGLEKAAAVYDPKSERTMEVYTNKPGVQLYTANFLGKDLKGKDGAVYQNREALCLETQFFPDSINHENFPSPILKAGERYDYTTIYKFL
ncbi:aldose epimerase family protein [Clostridium oryzae]|uniref:Aldose 1-epimerase n=1 Tax=Clostridium oryzae TaxID=1450648 RepID=A0A1V4IDU4_9CLOT|nr:aldose epimerase family protein [Clostridium oryzae]OPJ58089.1 aldose 1-epimerase precursor [Clostridium oryzae]